MNQITLRAAFDKRFPLLHHHEAGGARPSIDGRGRVPPTTARTTERQLRDTLTAIEHLEKNLKLSEVQAVSLYGAVSGQQAGAVASWHGFIAWVLRLTADSQIYRKFREANPPTTRCEDHEIDGCLQTYNAELRYLKSECIPSRYQSLESALASPFLNFPAWYRVLMSANQSLVGPYLAEARAEYRRDPKLQNAVAKGAAYGFEPGGISAITAAEQPRIGKH